MPLHSHDVDCCDLIIARELTIGRDTIGQGDGFFVPAGSAYGFFTGAEGVEFIEFGNANSWTIIFKPTPPAAWDKIVEKTRARGQACEPSNSPSAWSPQSPSRAHRAARRCNIKRRRSPTDDSPTGRVS